MTASLKITGLKKKCNKEHCLILFLILKKVIKYILTNNRSAWKVYFLNVINIKIVLEDSQNVLSDECNNDVF